jgi:ABC-2 type transport system permease protein
MEYKASFIMMALGSFVVNGVEFLAIWALFDRFKSVKGWTLPEVALLYGIVNISFAIAEAIPRAFDIFPSMVKSGEFDRILLRPRSTILQVLGQEFQIMRVGRLIQALIIFIWATSVLDIIWTPAKIILLIGTIIGGFCLFSGLFILYATISFWTVESLEIMNTTTYGGVETARFPLTIYNSWFRKFFTYVIPLGTISYIPALAILGRTNSIFNWVAPGIGIIFLIVIIQLWHFGVRHYCSTGS